MSKSPNILMPALGVTGIVLGAAYGMSTTNYKADELASLQNKVTTLQARGDEQSKTAETLMAELEQTKADMAARIAEVQDEATAAVAAAAAAAGSGDAAKIFAAAPARDSGYGLGREALPEEVAAWNVDVAPDGTGLPEGSGDVWTGETVFAEHCAICHGDFAEGVDNWPKLAGGADTLADEDPLKTVGSYWPHLSTAWDYVNRSMPFGNAQSLEPDDVYAIVAYILYSNDLVDDDFVLSHENLASFEMPNADGFIIDDRAETEYAQWRTEPCMENCKDEVKITMRATVLDVTPEETAAKAAAESAASTEEAVVEEAAAEETTAAAALDMALVEAGENVFKKCKSCHEVGDGAKNKTGPALNGVMGRAIGADEDFRYSKTFDALNEEGKVWDDAEMAAFLTKPRDYAKGTKMSFAGLRKEEDIAAVIEYLKSFPQ